MILAHERICEMDCGCRYDAPTGLVLYECEAHMKERHRLERAAKRCEAKQATRMSRKGEG